MLGHAVRDRVDLGFAELLREAELRLARELLIAQRDDAGVHDRAAQRRERRRVERLRHVHTRHLGAERARHRPHLDPLLHRPVSSLRRDGAE